MEIQKKNLNYVFHIQVEGLESKLTRDIIIDSNDTLASLAYMILASVNAMSHHMFKMNVKFNHDAAFMCVLLKDFKEEFVEEFLARDFPLWKFHLEEGDIIELEYGFGGGWHFTIHLIERRIELNKYSIPGVIKGKGQGIIEDVSIDFLKDIYENNTIYNGVDYNYFEIDDEKFRDYYIFLREIYEKVEDA